MKLNPLSFSLFIVFSLFSCALSLKTVGIQFLNEASPPSITAEIADTQPLREKGLMFRKHMGENEGMLFVWPEAVHDSFWMKNTPLSLDILFINSLNQIIDIKENAVPFSLDMITPKSPYSYVLEVNGGFCTRHRIKIGDKIMFEKTK